MAEDYFTARMVTLTDGVLSIAMTLLVLDVRLPGQSDTLSDSALWQQIIGIAPQISSYALSFLVIAILWINHVQRFRRLNKMTPLMTWLNILFLLGVSIVPFTTSLLAENGNAVSTAIYALGMAFASLMLAAMTIHVRAAGLVEVDPEATAMHTLWVLEFGTAAVFILSAAVAFVQPEWAKYCWLLLFPLNFYRSRHH